MQLSNWNDLRYLLAVKRGKSLAAAAKLTGVNNTTVSRRIDALEQDLGQALTHRIPNGALALTEFGQSVARQAQHAEQAIELIEDSASSNPTQCTGTVRLTSVPVVVNHLLAPNMGLLLQAHPKLTVELVPESRDLSLTEREADLALRLARPTAGGSQLKIRKIGTLPCAVFSHKKYNAQQIKTLPWITYNDALAHIPPERWMRKTAQQQGDNIANIKVNDAETALQSVLAGLGKTVLPKAIAGDNNTLRELPNKDSPGPPTRELWLVVHDNQSRLRRTKAVVNWIELLFAKHN